MSILVYCDFQAPACADAAQTLETLRADYADAGGVRTIWRHLPQTAFYDKSGLAMQAAEAAAAQDAFWPMHDLLLSEQKTWAKMTPEAFRTALVDYAASLELDIEAFEADLEAAAPLVERARLRAEGFGLAEDPVPIVAFNGKRYLGDPMAWALDATARAALLEQRWYPQSPTPVIDFDRDYRAILVTEKGDIVVDLFVEEAPAAVNNFVFLARDGWYDGNTFFHVLPGIMAVTGDPTGTGLGGPGYYILDEADNGLAFDEPGMVAMLRQADRPHSAGSQFFITMGPLGEGYNGVYTIFGQVTAGMETVESLTARDPFRDPLAPPGDRLEYILIQEMQE